MRTLPFGNVSYENKANEQGERLVWLDRAVVERLRSLCGPGESYSDVILRLVKHVEAFRRCRSPVRRGARRGDARP